MCVGIQGTNCFQPQTGYMREKVAFLAQNHPTGMKLEQDPFRLVQCMLLAPGEQREWAVGSALQPLQHSLPKTAAFECSLDKVSSQHPQYFGVALFCPQHTQLGLQCSVIYLNGYEVCGHNRLEIYVMIQNEQKWGEEGSANSKHAKKTWILERWFKMKKIKSLCHGCCICLCSNHRDSDWLQKSAEPCHSAWKDF